MFNFILRFFSFGMCTCLRIAVALTSNTYLMAMDIFAIMADTLRINLALPYPYSISNANRNVRQITYINHIRPNSSLSHNYTQTEECFALENNQRERSSNTDIFIYNLDSSKKITITHRNIDSNSVSMNSEDQFQTSKTQVMHSGIESIESDCSSLSHEENDCSDSCPHFSSNMSIENEVSDGQILQFSPIAEEVKGYKQSSKSTEGNQTDNCENKSDDTIDESDFEVDSQKTQVLETKLEDSTACEQKTSSPIRKSTRLAFFDPCNQLENATLRKKREMEDLSSETTDESPISDGEETRMNYFENTILLNDSARRRLSLPASFNTCNGAATLYADIKNKIEEAVNTSRYEKSVRDIKYPLLSETFLARDNEELKEIFSCSSYESLPVSEHLNNAFENSEFFSLYREDFISDFSSVDEFVEAVNKLKSSLSVSELIKNKIPASFSICTESKAEEKKFRGRSCEMQEAKKSQENYSNAFNNAMLKNISKDQEIKSRNSKISGLLIKPSRKLNSNLNSVYLKTECLSSDYEKDKESRKNYLMTCSDEEFSEEMNHIIKSVFDKIMSEIDDNELNISEKRTIEDQTEPEWESTEDIFVETTKSSCQSTLTEPLKLQDQTIVEIADTLPLQDENSIDEKIDVSLDNKLTELSQDESYENTTVTNSQIPVAIFEKQAIMESQNSRNEESELENTQLAGHLPNDETSEFIPPKATSDTEVKAHENDEKLDQSLTSVTETNNNFNIEDLSKRQIKEDRVSIAMKIDNIECDDGIRIVSTTSCRNDSLGNDNFLSFVEESSFYKDSNFNDSTRTLKELTCK